VSRDVDTVGYDFTVFPADDPSPLGGMTGFIGADVAFFDLVEKLLPAAIQSPRS
jgi:hypothetical protein